MNNINEILNKLKEMDYNKETCIAELINYNPEVDFVEPMTQMAILIQVCSLAEENNICLEENKEEKGGLGFFVKLKKVKSNNDVIINESNCNKEEYIYDFIPYEKIGPIFLNKNDESLYKPGGVRYLQENAFNHVLCRPCFLEHPEHIKRGLNNERLFIIINKEKIKINCFYSDVLDNFKKVTDDFVELSDSLDNGNLTKTAYSRKLGIIIFATMEANEYYIYSIRFLGKEQFEKSIEDEINDNRIAGEDKMEEFKINNNIEFEDEETKIEYQKYLDEINEYNRKIANGEKPEKDLSAITEEFKQKFNVSGSETTSIEDKNLDELIEKLNKSLDSKYTDTNLSFEEQIDNIDKRIEELNNEEDK